LHPEGDEKSRRHDEDMVSHRTLFDHVQLNHAFAAEQAGTCYHRSNKTEGDLSEHYHFHAFAI
jgi:hypothetical protein